MSREEIRDKLITMIEPIVEKNGLELVQLDYISGRNGLLHLYIDREGGVTIADCETTSRAVSGFLGTCDPLPHEYLLEVSSPGLERPLRKKEHFLRFLGEKIKVRTNVKVSGRNKFSGTLQTVATDSITLLLEDGNSAEIFFSTIVKANLWYIQPGKQPRRLR